MFIKSLVEGFSEKMKLSMSNNNFRRGYQLIWMYALLGIVSAGMTLLNIITNKGYLTFATLFFSILCVAAIVLLRRGNISLDASELFFILTIYCLFVFFIVSGNPDGFSILWVLLLPSCSPLLFGKRKGVIASVAFYLIILFLFFVPAGKALVTYNYNETFIQRFPLLYLAFFAVGYLLEVMRYTTYSELEELREKYRFQSCHDALTGVLNRQGFNEIMDSFFIDNKGTLSLIILDLDYFKNINDEFGHQQGDVALVETANIIKKAVGDNWAVCRWGGEEFAILSEKYDTDAEIAETIRRSIEKNEILCGEKTISITASLGEALVKDCSEVSAQKVVLAADRCLYKAKENGRNKVVSLEMN